MTNTTRVVLTSFAAISLAIAPSVFAQRSGGHGGGGGARSSGGFSGSGARSTSGASSARPSARSYRAAPSAPSYSRPSGSYARSGANAYRPAPARNAYRPPAAAANRGTAYARGGASAVPASHEAPADNQWHSFVPRASTETSASSRATNSGVRTFVGDGHDLYEEVPRAAAAPAAARPAAGLRAASPAASIAFAFGQRTFAAPGFAGSARFNTFGFHPFVPLRVHPGIQFGFGISPAFQPAFGAGFGFGFSRYRPFGLGYGLGFGFGWNPCWGWDDPFCFGGFSGPAYDYYGNPPYDPNAYPPQIAPDSNEGPGDDSAAPPDSQPPLGGGQPSEPVDPNWDTSVNAQVPAKPGSVVIYLKNGTSISPSDYWIADDQLHYTVGGAENTLALDRVDLRRTNDENAKNGVTFWLKSEPQKNPAAASSDAPAASGSSPAASPDPEPPSAEPNDNAAPGPSPYGVEPDNAPSPEPL